MCEQYIEVVNRVSEPTKESACPMRACMTRRLRATADMQPYDFVGLDDRTIEPRDLDGRVGVTQEM